MLPKGTSLLINPAAVHFHPHIWGPDAHTFDPDRWDRLEADTAASPFAFEAFIQGPRICIGKPFAMLQLKVLLIELLTKWEFAPSGDPDKKIGVANPAYILKPKRDLEVVVERRLCRR